MRCPENELDNTVVIGDSLKYLKFMQKNQLFADIIYIDPPYNTGNNFSYNDKRSSNDWISFIKKNLIISHSVLKESGVIFISIDDSSLYDLKIACDSIFNKQNFLGNFITKQAIRSNSRHINTVHEYILAYAKNKKELKPFKIKRTDNPNDATMIRDISEKVYKVFKKSGRIAAEKTLAKINNEYMLKKNITWLRNYSQVDENGEVFFAKDLSVPGEPADLAIPEINLKLAALPTRKWSSAQKIIKLHNENKLFFKGSRPYEKHFLKDSYDNVSSILDFYSRQGTNDLNKLGLRDLFDTPKPTELIKYLIRIATYHNNSAVVLDYFAGSGTTGQAVMEVNQEDNKSHSYTLVQLNETIRNNTPQYRFAIKHDLKPTVDQLMIFRLKTAKNKLNYHKDFQIIDIT